MRILIFGGVGFVGANVAEALAGEELYAAHRPGSPQRKPEVARFVSQFAALVEYRDPATALEKTRPHVVINLVGQYHGDDYALKEANAEFPRALCESAKKTGWRGKVIHISGATVRGPVGGVIKEEERHLEGVAPSSSFDKYKAEGERVVSNCFEDWVIIRPVLVYGRFNDHPEWVMLTRFVARGLAPIVAASVSAISARELAKVVKASLSLTREFFFATECRTRAFGEFIDAMAKALGKGVVKVPVPKALLKIAAPRPLRRHLPFLDKTFSCDKMKRLTGVEPAPDFDAEVGEMTHYIMTRLKKKHTLNKYETGLHIYLLPTSPFPHAQEMANRDSVHS
ncbi:MAG: NAD(P)-dependent oxidoreductase [Pyrobaculum sp.]